MAAALSERIAQRVRDAVEADEDLTEEALAVHSGIALRTMRRRMTGKVAWNTDELAAVAEALHRPVSYLIDESSHAS